MQKTLLSKVLSNMNAWQDISNIGEEYKVRALDSGLRSLRRDTVFPWTIQKGSLRVFDDVLEYPVESDHDEIAYIDNTKGDGFSARARFTYTSLQQFFEDVQNNRNQIAEIWDGGTKYLGVRYKDISRGSQQLSNAETVGDYSVADDATAVALDNVNFKEGNGSMKITVVSSSGIATILNSFTSYSDTNYQRKYQFRWIYLGAVPTSIELRLQTSATKYLKTVVTTQFSGQAFKANQWNLIAQDLNTATKVGVFNSASIASEKVILNGAATGTYYLDNSYARAWELMDYWYYSIYNVVGITSTSADKEYFMDSDDAYETGDYLLGDTEWIGVIMYEALELLMADIENVRLFSVIQRKKREAWDALNAKYPDMVPLITTKRYRFNNDPISSGLNTNLWSK